MYLIKKLDDTLETKEINQVLSSYVARKSAETLENYSGSWRLFGGIEGHIIPH